MTMAKSMLDELLIDPAALELLGIKSHPLAKMKLGDAEREDVLLLRIFTHGPRQRLIEGLMSPA